MEFKSSHVKDILIAEFGDDIGFQTRYQRNQSTIVYSSKEAGNYIESVINFWGFDTNELLKAAAKRVKHDLSSQSQMVWPPKVTELTSISEKEKETPDAIQLSVMPRGPSLTLRRTITYIRGNSNFWH